MSLVIANLMCLVISLVLFFTSLMTKKRFRKKEKLFSIGLLFISLFSLFNAFANGLYLISPNYVNISYGFKVLVIILFGALSSIFSYYTFLTVSERVPINKEISYLMVLPFIWNIICAIINDFNYALYSFDQYGFHRNKLYFIVTFHLVIGLCYDLYLIIKYHKELNKSTIRLLSVFPIFGLIYFLVSFINSFINLEFPLLEFMFVLISLFLYIFNEQELIQIDSLTKCYGRNQLLLDLKKAKNKSLICLDIDRFRQYHFDLGDEILTYISKFLTESFGEMVYRISADKFVVMFDYENSIKALSEINRHFSKPINIHKKSILINVRLSMIENVGEEDENKVMYILGVMDRKIKESKKNYLIYDDTERRNIKEYDLLVNNIINQVNSKEVSLSFQGIYEKNSSKLLGAEIFSRLFINDTLVHPESFLSVLIDNEYISAFDKIVIEKGLISLKEESTLKNLKVIIFNITPMDLMDNLFINFIYQTLNRLDLDPNVLYFELKEDSILGYEQKIKIAMEELVQFGCHFCLDGYGVASSNINKICYLPFDFIKIDKSCLFNARSNSKNQLILKSVIELFKKLGKRVTIEGIETKEDYEFVKTLDADLLQGYYFSKPLLIDEFIKNNFS